MKAIFPGGTRSLAAPADDKPPDNFIDNTVRRYKLNPDGSKGELIGTQEAFPEKLDKRDYSYLNMKGVDELMDKQGKQTPNPNPAQATNQEPDQGAQESKDSIANTEGNNQAESATCDEQAKNLTLTDLLMAEASQKEQDGWEVRPHTVGPGATVLDYKEPFSWDVAWPIAQKLLAEGLYQFEVAERIGTTLSALKHRIAREKEKPVKLTDPQEICDHLAMKWIKDVEATMLPTGMKRVLIKTVSCMEWPGV